MFQKLHYVTLKDQNWDVTGSCGSVQLKLTGKKNQNPSSVALHLSLSILSYFILPHIPLGIVPLLSICTFMSVLHYSCLLRPWSNTNFPKRVCERVCVWERERERDVHDSFYFLSSLCAACDYTPYIKPRCFCSSWTAEEAVELQGDDRADHFSTDRIGSILHTPLLPSFSLSLSLSSHHLWSVESIRVWEATLKISSRIQSAREYKMHTPLAMWWWGKRHRQSPSGVKNLCICKLN